MLCFHSFGMALGGSIQEGRISITCYGRCWVVL